MHDVIIAGGGIAGLSAALILGRCRRQVLVCDTGKPRNRASQAMHGFLSRDGIHPLEMRRLAREQLTAYPTVTCMEMEVTDAQPTEDGYLVVLADGSFRQCRYLLITTGIVDKLPEIEGIDRFYGHDVFHCPYCDGWELADQPVALCGQGQNGFEYALELLTWTRDIVLCTDGGEMPSQEQVAELERWGIRVIGDKIAVMDGEVGREIDLHFADGQRLKRRALFFYPFQWQASALAEKLGCTVTDGGVVEAGKFQQTKQRLFVAGDAARSIQLAIVAAAEGAEAAFALNSALLKETLATGPQHR